MLIIVMSILGLARGRRRMDGDEWMLVGFDDRVGR
jgi:hypothetical protein